MAIFIYILQLHCTARAPVVYQERGAESMEIHAWGEGMHDKKYHKRLADRIPIIRYRPHTLKPTKQHVDKKNRL
jgi:hypothetical protein